MGSGPKCVRAMRGTLPRSELAPNQASHACPLAAPSLRCWQLHLCWAMCQNRGAIADHTAGGDVGKRRGGSPHMPALRSGTMHEPARQHVPACAFRGSTVCAAYPHPLGPSLVGGRGVRSAAGPVRSGVSLQFGFATTSHFRCTRKFSCLTVVPCGPTALVGGHTVNDNRFAAHEGMHAGRWTGR